MTEDLARHERAAAQAVAGNEAPSSWLLAAAANLAHELSYCILTDARLLKRVELTQQLTALRNASKFIDGLLFPFLHGGSASLLLSDHLLREGEYRLEYEAELHQLLTDLAERCEASLGLVPKGGGQGRALSALVEENTASSHTVCALAVQLLWKETHDKLPGLNSNQAHRACSELWLAAGGKGTKTVGWITDLQEAREPRYENASKILASVIGVQGIQPKMP